MTKTMIQTQAKKKRSLPRSKKAARIAIAQDVIKRVNTFGSIESTYLNTDNYDAAELRKKLGKTSAEIDGREHFEDIAPICQVCAKGALFMCHVDIFDEMSFRDISRTKSDKGVCRPLLNHFTHRQLDLIETAFEKGVQDSYKWLKAELRKLPQRRAKPYESHALREKQIGYEWYSRPWLPSERQPMVHETDEMLIPDVKAAIKFGRRFTNRKNCLKAICQNIVDNDGTFKP